MKKLALLILVMGCAAGAFAQNATNEKTLFERVTQIGKNFVKYHVAMCNYLFIFKSRFSDFAFNSDSTKSFCWNSYDVYCVFYIENDRKKREYSV